ncbi:hypothetical protein KP05_08785 [Cobetia amphilecti]|uniref:gamma-glutamylcyclotransferase family protein n=1 Tax=Cobetia amphilecti TaxID=1055104 RepID=UPI000503899B|nr:gamma-glutamylcyclotransferase family protein [Cobetia amphilecti]KGA02093.1 hypothetical protein KP05_08785 [Cobetia amphilecti]
MEHLFIYGPLGPGGLNEHVIANIDGEWSSAYLRGRLENTDHGAEHKFPGLVVDNTGQVIRGHVFSSAQLPEHWDALDDFEGPIYQRTVTTVILDDNRELEAYVYALPQ